MAFDFEVRRWEDSNGDRHDGKPSDIDDVYGMFVQCTDPATGETHWFWAYTYITFGDWDEWVGYIGGLMEMHGMNLA